MCRLADPAPVPRASAPRRTTRCPRGSRRPPRRSRHCDEPASSLPRESPRATRRTRWRDRLRRPDWRAAGGAVAWQMRSRTVSSRRGRGRRWDGPQAAAPAGRPFAEALEPSPGFKGRSVGIRIAAEGLVGKFSWRSPAIGGRQATCESVSYLHVPATVQCELAWPRRRLEIEQQRASTQPGTVPARGRALRA